MYLQEVGLEAWTGLIWLRLCQVAGCCEFGDKLSASIKCGEFVEQVRTGQILRKDCVPCNQLVSQLVSIYVISYCTRKLKIIGLFGVVTQQFDFLAFCEMNSQLERRFCVCDVLSENDQVGRCIYIYIHTSILGHIQGVSRLQGITAGGDFLGLCDQKSSYKHVSDFGQLGSYDRLKLRIEGNDY